MIKRILISTFLVLTLVTSVNAAPKKDSGKDGDQGDIIQPTVERREIKLPEITSDDIEVGLSIGLYSLDDFGTNPVAEIFSYYHLTEKMFVGASVGFTTANTETLDLFGVLDSLENDSVNYFNLLYGYNIFPGEIFSKSGRAWTSSAYFIGGIGATEVNNDSNFTIILGGGLRMVPLNWLAVHLDVRDNIYQRTILDAQKTTHNLQMTIGASYFF